MSGQFGGNMWEQDGAQNWSANQQQFAGSGQPYSNFYSGNDMILNADQLSFEQSNFDASYTSQPSAHQQKMSFFYDQPPSQQFADEPTMEFQKGTDPETEPPLLEELEIYPELIVKKIKAVLNPFTSAPPVGDHDLGGPLIFCLLFGVTTFFSGGRINFSYVYGMAVSSCIFMYLLLYAMAQKESAAIFAVASVLGYSLIPVVALSTLAIFLRLTNVVGIILAVLAVCWASLAASKEFTYVTGDDQKLLIAYPCAILYGVFTLLVIF